MKLFSKLIRNDLFYLNRWNLRVVAIAVIVSHLVIRGFIWKWFKWNGSIDGYRQSTWILFFFHHFLLWQSIEADLFLFLCGEWWWWWIEKKRSSTMCLHLNDQSVSNRLWLNQILYNIKFQWFTFFIVGILKLHQMLAANYTYTMIYI